MMTGLIQRAFWLGILLSVAGGVIWGWGMGVSILAGAMVAWLNFHWMRRGVDRVLLGGLEEKSDLKIALQYILRLLLILVTLFAIIHFSFLSLLGGIAGLSIFVLAGMLEAIILLFQQIPRER